MARILVIDDNHDNLELMQYLLRAFGHDALAADGGVAGIALIRRERPDMVVSDIHMPGTDGYAVLQAIRDDALLRATPVLAVTALTMRGDRERGLSAGFDGYIAKPIDPQTFIDQIESFLPSEQRGGTARRHPEPAPEATPLASQPRRCLARVLVVDDSAANRELICQILLAVGYDVCAAEDVRSGLQMALESAPDLVITDLHMPGEDGFELVRAIKASPRLTAVPVVVVTSSAWGEHHRRTAFELGAARFLLNPVEPQRLLDEVAGCLEEGGADGNHPGR